MHNAHVPLIPAALGNLLAGRGGREEARSFLVRVQGETARISDRAAELVEHQLAGLVGHSTLLAARTYMRSARRFPSAPGLQLCEDSQMMQDQVRICFS